MATFNGFFLLKLENLLLDVRKNSICFHQPTEKTLKLARKIPVACHTKQAEGEGFVGDAIDVCNFTAFKDGSNNKKRRKKKF